MKKRIPYGVCNFQEIIEGNYYYIDKSRFIETLETRNTPVFLRPRRFGKSLFSEMLRWYYDLKAADQFEKLFGGLYIGKNPTSLKNSFFFLALDFSGLSSYSHENRDFAMKNFNEKVLDDITGFLIYYQKELNLDKEDIRDFKQDHNENAGAALAGAVNFVKNAGGKMYLAIDEYDSMTNAMAINYINEPDEKNEYMNITHKGGFFRSFFEYVKNCTKSALKKVYITGILPITISDLNSGFNIAEWITHDEDFENMLGITESELDTFLAELYRENPQLFLSINEVKSYLKRYYNGYRFGEYSENVYNPMMTMYFLNNLVRHNRIPKILADENIKVQYNQMAYIFGRNNKKRDEVIEEITDKKRLEFSITPGRLFDLRDYKSGRYINECLYYLGLLTYGENPFEFVVPNLVTYEMILSYFERIKEFEPDRFDFDRFVIRYLKDGDINALIKAFFEEIVRKFPGDFFKDVNESFYRGLLFHVLYRILPKNLYEVLPEFNLTTGTVDLIVESFDNPRVMAKLEDLIEIKRVPKSATDSQLDAKFEKAKKQVVRYQTGDYKEFRAVAVCFRGNRDYKIRIY